MQELFIIIQLKYSIKLTNCGSKIAAWLIMVMSCDKVHTSISSALAAHRPEGRSVTLYAPRNATGEQQNK